MEYRINDNMIVFNLENETKGEGVIFYPGGKVDYLSYIPLLQSIAKEGYTCVLIKIPFNLEVFDYKAADKAIKSMKI